MSRPIDRRALAAWLLLVIAIASVAYATPWAAPFRKSVSPTLPIIGVILGTLAGVMNLVMAILAGFSRREGWSAAASPAAFGIGGLCLAIALLPSPHDTAPHTIPLVGCVLFTIAGVVLQQRARERSDSL
jgi:hypothetical protein